jgi:RNA polymerase sigma factor (sigma-70 family)
MAEGATAAHITGIDDSPLGTPAPPTDTHALVPLRLETDDFLWRRVRSGDPDAFGELFERRGRAIYNYCFRRTANWAAAEDLCSTVFLEAWRRRDQELMPGKVLPWLYGIATNVARNHRRSLRRRGAALVRVGRPGPTPDFADDAVGRLDDERQMADVLRAVAQLSERQQDVLALCVWSGLSYEDAAQALDIPVGSVKSNLSRARARVVELLAGNGHGQVEQPSTVELQNDA